MQHSHSNPHLDLGTVWRAFKRPWQRWTQWPVLAWLRPEVRITLLTPHNADTAWRARDLTQPLPARPKNPADETPFQALLLPEAAVLTRTVELPDLPAPMLTQALQLQVATLSPFAADDLAWGYRTLEDPRLMRSVLLIMASRRQIGQLMLQLTEPLAAKAHQLEVWAGAVDNPVVMQGFGEIHRARFQQRRFRQNVALMVIAGCLMLAMLVTPVLQIRQQGIEALATHAALVEKTAALTSARATLAKQADQLRGLAQLTGDRPEPLWVLERITQMMPDDTYLFALNLEGAKITLSGYTPNTAALMQRLSGEPGIREVKAPSAATRPLGSAKESFTVEFLMDKQRPDALPRPATLPAASSASATPFPTPAASSTQTSPSPATSAASGTTVSASKPASTAKP